MPKSSSDVLAVLKTDELSAIKLTRSDAITVSTTETTPGDVARALAIAVPPNTAVGAFVLLVDESYLVRKACVEALHDAGFKNVTSISAMSMCLSFYLQHPIRNVAINEVIALIYMRPSFKPTDYLSCSVLQLCADGGYRIIAFAEFSHDVIPQTLKTVKKIVFLMAETVSSKQRKQYEALFPKKKFYYREVNYCCERLVLWNKFDNVKGRIHEVCSIALKICFMKKTKVLEKEFSLQFEPVPFKRDYKIVADAGIVEVYAGIDKKWGFVTSFKCTSLIPQLLAMNVFVGVDLLPRVGFTEITKPNESNAMAVHALSFDSTTETFSGSVIIGDNAEEVIAKATFQDALAAMANYKPNIFVLGIFLNYNEAHIPFEIHRKIVPQIQNYREVFVTAVHCWLTIYLHMTNLSFDAGDLVCITDWTKDEPLYYVLTFENGTFRMILHFTHNERSFLNYKNVILVTDKEVSKSTLETDRFFVHKDVCIVDSKMFKPSMLMKYAWQVLTHSKYSGHMINPVFCLDFTLKFNEKTRKIILRFVETDFTLRTGLFYIGEESGELMLSMTCLGSDVPIALVSQKFEKSTYPREVDVTFSIDQFYVPNITFVTKHARVERENVELPSSIVSGLFNVANNESDVSYNFQEKVSFKPWLPVLPTAPCDFVIIFTTNDKFFYRWHNDDVTYHSPFFVSYSIMMKAFNTQFPPQHVKHIVECFETSLGLRERNFRGKLLERYGYTSVFCVSSDIFVLSLSLNNTNAVVNSTGVVITFNGRKFGVFQRDDEGLQVKAFTDLNLTDFIKTVNAYSTDFIFFYGDILKNEVVLTNLESIFNDRRIIKESPGDIIKLTESYVKHMINGTDFDGCFIHNFNDFKFSVSIDDVFISNHHTTFFKLPSKFFCTVKVDKGTVLQVYTDYRTSSNPKKVIHDEINVSQFHGHAVFLLFNIIKPYKCIVTIRDGHQNKTDQVVFISRKNQNVEVKTVKVGADRHVLSKLTSIHEALRLFPIQTNSLILFDVTNVAPLERDVWRRVAQKSGYADAIFSNTLCVDLEILLSIFKQVDCSIGESLFVADGTKLDTEVMVFVLHRHKRGFKILGLGKNVFELRRTFPNVKNAFLVGNITKSMNDGFDGLHWLVAKNKDHNAMNMSYILLYLFNKRRHRAVNICLCSKFIFTWNNKSFTFDSTFKDVPFKETFYLYIGFAKTVSVNCKQYGADETYPLNPIEFVDNLDRFIEITITLNQYMVPTIDVISHPMPPFVLSFTEDNLIHILTNEKDKAKMCLPAFVSFNDNDIKIGETARRELQTNPEFVVYDILRLMSSNLNVHNPNPQWHFQVHRDTDDRVCVSLGTITIFVDVLFGIIVKMIVKLLKEHDSTTFSSIGIHLSNNAQITDIMRADLSRQLNTDIILFG